MLTPIFDEKKADVRSGDEGDKEPDDVGTHEHEKRLVPRGYPKESLRPRDVST